MGPFRPVVKARAFLGWSVAIAGLVAAPGAARGADGDDAAKVLRRAEEEDRALDFARALADYDAAKALDPSGPTGARAEARAREIARHAEGAFAPYAELERVRRDPALASDEAAIDALARDADAFPPGAVRIEAWALAAEAYEHRLARPHDAAALYRKILEAPEADPVLARKAARDLVELDAARGDLDGAAAAVRLAGDRADAKLARDVARLVRRRYLHLASIAIMTATLLLAALAAASAARRGALGPVRTALRRIAALAVAYAAYVAIVGAILATRYEPGTSRPFLLFGAALLPLLFVARAWAAAGGRSRIARAFRGAACAACVAAAAFLVLERVDASYLAGMGL